MLSLIVLDEQCQWEVEVFLGDGPGFFGPGVNFGAKDKREEPAREPFPARVCGL